MVVAKLEAQNETQKCSRFYIFIGSVQLKSLGQTNLLLVHRREFTSSLLCLTDTNGLVTSNSRLTFNLFVRTTSTYILCPDAFYLARLDRNLTAERRCFGRSDLARLERNYLQKAKMTQIDLSLEAYKESRQKRLVEHREYNLAKLEAKKQKTGTRTTGPNLTKVP